MTSIDFEWIFYDHQLSYAWPSSTSNMYLFFFYFLNMECDACSLFQHIFFVQREKFIIIEERAEEEEEWKSEYTRAAVDAMKLQKCDK